MSKVLDFINEEKNSLGKIYVDINYAIDNISPFLDKDVLDKRKYVHKLPILKQYMDLLQKTEVDEKKEGFFGFLNDSTQINKLNDFKYNNKDIFNQLQKCSTCSCLNCTADCKFDCCLGCRPGSHIAKCDHKKINVTLHNNFTLELNNDDTGRIDSYKVLATFQDTERNQKYIMIQNLRTNEKFVLYYYPGISEDTYGQITDADEFDYVVSTFESVE